MFAWFAWFPRNYGSRKDQVNADTSSAAHQDWFLVRSPPSSFHCCYMPSTNYYSQVRPDRILEYVLERLLRKIPSIQHLPAIVFGLCFLHDSVWPSWIFSDESCRFVSRHNLQASCWHFTASHRKSSLRNLQ